jgi:hypothetical protein
VRQSREWGKRVWRDTFPQNSGTGGADFSIGVDRRGSIRKVRSGFLWGQPSAAYPID